MIKSENNIRFIYKKILLSDFSAQIYKVLAKRAMFGSSFGCFAKR